MPRFSISIEDYLRKLANVSSLVRSEKSDFSGPLDYLESKNLDFVLIGGLASSQYSPARLTDDVDILLENESRLEEFKKSTIGEVKWVRKHAFVLGGIEVETLTPEFLKIPNNVSNYVFSTKVKQSSGFYIPSAEGVLLLKLHSLRDYPDKQDILSIVKTQGNKLDLDLVKSLTSEEGRKFLEESISKSKIFMDDQLD